MQKYRLSCRMGWVQYSLLLVLAPVGLMAGWVLSVGFSFHWNKSLGANEMSPVATRFALSPLDVNDTVEAPEISADSLGGIYVGWASKVEAGQKHLKLTYSTDGGTSFSTPTTVIKSQVFHATATGQPVPLAPHLIARQQVLNLAWTEARPGLSGVQMMTAYSIDHGKTFSPALSVHQGAGAMPSSTAFAMDIDGNTLCSWLDPRSTIQQVTASRRLAGSYGFEPEQVLLPGDANLSASADCPMASVYAPDGTLYVAFRTTVQGYQHVAIARRLAGASRFENPITITPSTWKQDASPREGLSLAIKGNYMHLVWMDAHTGVPRCYHAWSPVQDLKFTVCELHQPGIGSQGNAKLFAEPQGDLHVVWEADARSGRTIWHATMPNESLTFGPASEVDPKPGVVQTHPCVAVTPKGKVFVAWHELTESGKSVVVTQLPSPKRPGKGVNP